MLNPKDLDDIIMKEMKAFVDEDEKHNFLGVKKEWGDSYVIYWFVWEKDGIFDWPDWEPVIMVFRGQQLSCVSVRRHFRWEDYRADKLVRPLTVYFGGPSHAPTVKAIADAHKFDKLVSKGVVPVPLDRSVDQDVPDFARDPRLLKKFGSKGMIAELWHTILRQKPVDERIQLLLEICEVRTQSGR